MPISSDVLIAQGGTAEWDFLAIPGNSPTWTPKYGYTTYTWGSDPRFKTGGSFHGWFYGVVGTGGYAWNDGNKPGPEVNDYSNFAGVLGTGVYVTGVAGTSINNVGVYGQTGDDPDLSIPKDQLAGVFGASSTATGVFGWSAGYGAAAVVGATEAKLGRGCLVIRCWAAASSALAHPTRTDPAWAAASSDNASTKDRPRSSTCQPTLAWSAVRRRKPA